jgi:hypothetical protein
MNYKTAYDVKYSNDQEYRKCLREVFDMDLTVPEETIRKLETINAEIFDEETIDEMLFDYEQTEAAMNFIFEKTKDSSEFQELYLLAAAKMISLNLSIGMSICFSYDYFNLFHKYLVVFLVEKRIDKEKHEELKNSLKN